MRIAFPAPVSANEKRYALTEQGARRLIDAGHVLIAQTPAYPSELGALGVTCAGPDADVLAEADALIVLDPPSPAQLALMRDGAVLIGLLAPHDARERIQDYADAGLSAFALELIPRTARAQAMDVLSSQSNLVGYRAVIEAAALYGRVFPMMMTAAGSLAPARVFVMGAGVAGLQAIATARRLGAIVSATDVRPAAKEQVESLSASFIAVNDEEFRAAETAAGYARPMSEAYQAKQAALVAEHIASQDIVITTALIPGRPAPRLVSEDMIATMRTGSVVIDLAAAAGGNCALSRPDETVISRGVTIVGLSAFPGALAADASAMLSANICAYLPLMTGDDGALSPHWDDDIIRATALTRDGALFSDSPMEAA